uniref:PPM-type phosphatase domain-containing protein n=1 Tax=Panagrolaimus sp. JU765 TaxID=591449 RepID=A0AC34PUY6_9BILA
MSPRGQPPPVPESQETIPPPKIGMVVDMADTHYIGGLIPVVTGNEKQKHPYCRPEFLYLSEDEINLSSDQSIRPILLPKYPTQMPAYAGYAEVINTSKSVENEDMAAAKILTIIQQGYDAEKAIELDDAAGKMGQKNKKLERKRSDEDLLDISQSFSSDDGPIAPKAEAAYFGIFDGHAGSGAAIMAANCLHEHVKNRLSEVLETTLHLDRQKQFSKTSHRSTAHENDNQKHHSSITSDSLIIGALEAAFVDMDQQIAEEKMYAKIPGGTAALACLIFLEKVYIANAGDCRALLVTANEVKKLSNDFNPIYERKRLQYIAYRKNDVISPHFCRLEFSRFLTSKDLNRKVLFRDWYMDGWAAKTVKECDLKPPLISTRTKKPRLLNTIGVCRGFGDHHLMTADDKIAIKPFLCPYPEIQIYDTRELECLTDKEVIILASDGLWDVLTNTEVANITRAALSHNDDDDFSKYTLVAQELVAAARGELVGQFKWKLASGGMASTDDITVFVIPLKFAVNMPKIDDDDDEEMLS